MKSNGFHRKSGLWWAPTYSEVPWTPLVHATINTKAIKLYHLIYIYVCMYNIYFMYT